MEFDSAEMAFSVPQGLPVAWETVTGALVSRGDVAAICLFVQIISAMSSS